MDDVTTMVTKFPMITGLAFEYDTQDPGVKRERTHTARLPACECPVQKRATALRPCFDKRRIMELCQPNRPKTRLPGSQICFPRWARAHAYALCGCCCLHTLTGWS